MNSNIALCGLSTEREYVLTYVNSQWVALPMRHKGPVITEIDSASRIVAEPYGPRPRTLKLPKEQKYAHPLERAERQAG